MRTYLISYDLGVPETSEDYKKLIDHIKSYYTWAKPLYSVWLIRTEQTVTQVRDSIKKLVDTNDKVFVVDVTSSNWASHNLPSEVLNWIKTNL